MELPGTIDHFEILERLGGGGMGVVYKARDLKLGRTVALKFMCPSREGNEESRIRFLREARAVAALDHPNICTLFEIRETDDGRIFLAMAFCPGETLRERLGRGPLPPCEAIEMALQILDGLAAAHSHGIIHRDIKPGNLLLCDGLVKIIDFGVARLSDQSTITREGVAIGTLCYTAPELLFEGGASPMSDLWSVGVVLYEALAGRLPFQASTVPQMVMAILKSTPAPLEGVGPALGRIVERALARSPRLRYQNAEEMKKDLVAALPNLDDASEPQTWDLRPFREEGPPRLHNLPFPPLGDLLKGRAEDLQDLKNALDDASTDGVPTHTAQVLHGLGGIGKTRLALEHAWKYGASHRAVLFVLADSPEGLNSGLAGLARAEVLNLPERDAPAESEVTAAVLRWLRETSGWLMILDNVDTKEALLAVTRLLPSLSGGRTLITSRRRDWPPGVHRQSIDVIPPPAATDFLLKRTASDRRKEPDDVLQALRLAELLDGLPLALEQAAAYITHTQISISAYLEIWETECDSALGWYDEGVMQYPASLAVTWQSSFRQLAPTAQALLRLLSYMAPDPIPVAMLEAGAGIVQEAAGSTRPIREDLGELAALSFISRQQTTITVHCLVQEVVRQGVPEIDRKSWIDLTVKLLVQYAPSQADDSATWDIWDPLRPHALEALAHATANGIENVCLGKLITTLSILLSAKALYSDAEPLLRRVLELDMRLFGPNDAEIAVGYTNLANLLQFTQRWQEAEEMAHRALEIDLRIFGDRHPRTARGFNQLGLLLGETGRLDEGEELLRKALAIDLGIDSDPSAVARDLHNLAYLLRSAGRNEEAEPLIRRALELSRIVHGNRHTKTARRMQILAEVLYSQGRQAEAEPLVEQAFEIFNQLLGPHHPRTQSARLDLEAIKQNGETPEEVSPLRAF